MTLREFRKLTADLPGTTRLLISADDRNQFMDCQPWVTPMRLVWNQMVNRYRGSTKQKPRVEILVG